MSNSRSFDRAAHNYDQTRLLLEPITKYGIPALLEVIGPQARVLEAGSGTGRISIPLLERGVDLVGCDLSVPMLRRFQGKFPAPRIVQADASLLPFPSAHFDTVLTVHVMHLIPAWRETFREFRRVLAPGGAYLNVSTWAPVGVSMGGQIRDFWRGWLTAQGVTAGHPGVREPEEFLKELRSMGAAITQVEAVRYRDSFNLAEELDRFASRVYSETWDLPDAIFEASIEALRTWAQHEYGSLDREIQDEVRFVIDVARFEG
ncbi:MAG TPA: class I SAM-dependent methyltransferase [Anaerolineales bacterium]|nr:class I SAM-dependent methyltransferase [Anaerolineales bacterium]